MERQKGLIVGLVQQYKAAKAQIADLEMQLKAQNKEVQRITMDEVPALMNEISVKEMKMDDGTVVKVKPDFTCGIPSETAINKTSDTLDKNALMDRKEQCLNHIRGSEGADIIKTNLMVDIGKDKELRQQLENLLSEFTQQRITDGKTGVSYSVAEVVHPQTLKAWIKEKLEKGIDVPASFGVQEFTIASIK